MPSLTDGSATPFEKVPDDEPAQIDDIANLTVQLLDRRYSSAPRVLRGVHPKDHGCVEATFTVAENIKPEHRVGVFKHPGRQYRSVIRFSNASALVTPDTPLEQTAQGQVRAHGSRGMAIKLYDVQGDRLVPNDGERSQDFLMINQPVFAFANVEDYQALNRAMVAHPQERPDAFFARMGAPDPVGGRAQRTLGIIRQVKSLLSSAPSPAAFTHQAPPLSPFDNHYFSAAPFLFGKDRVMKFSANPVNPMTGEVGDAVNDPDYLRNALRERMAKAGGNDICFDFQIQVRTAEQIGDIDSQIEDMCTEWKDEFVTVARIAIPPQDVTSPERQEFCETLFYTPWHGLDDHRPIGGINRMRRKVYDVSADRRGCPVSPELPPADRGRSGSAPGQAGRGGPGQSGRSDPGKRPREAF